MRLLLLMGLILSSCLNAATAGKKPGLEFSLHKLESGVPGPTLLVVGGIQGDEPGGFNAASLLVTNYTIESGSVWVVPNLNFESIVKRSRGVYGDMNRKFSTINEGDPEYDAVQKIKSIILDEQVDLVLNLHDGSGFYRPEHIDRLHSPLRWGQCIVIDQKSIGDLRLERLADVANGVISSVNRHITNPEHHYRVKNTRTRMGDVEMEKTLTYFAIKHGKPAAGVEASKSLSTHRRAYYHLRVLEGYMDTLGIRYERDFGLTVADVKRQIDGNVHLALYENRILFDMSSARKLVRFVPMKKDAPLQFTASNPLVAVTNNDNYYKVSYGNRSVTRLQPEYWDYDETLENIDLVVDGEATRARIGTIVEVTDSFVVEPRSGYRINAIGFKKPGLRNESGILMRRRDFAKRLSLDKNAQLYRLEVYFGDKFSGMVLVRFTDHPVATSNSPAKALTDFLLQSPVGGSS